MNIKICPARIADIAAILQLIEEFAEFEELTDFFEITGERLREVMFGENGFVRGLLVFDEETPVGYALFYPAFLSFSGQRSVYLEDIYITKGYRKHGIGESVIKEVARCGLEFGASRMDFQVLRSNKDAIDFYVKHGAAVIDDERHLKFTGAAFKNLAE